MDVIITDWAFNSYLELKHQRIFSAEEYDTVLRPDANRLKEGFPSRDPKFQSDRFWGPATDRSGNTMPNIFKMKWHNIGSGRHQLRLGIFILEGKAYLCRGYVKKDDKTDKREMGRLKIHAQDIRSGEFTIRGYL